MKFLSELESAGRVAPRAVERSMARQGDIVRRAGKGAIVSRGLEGGGGGGLLYRL